MGRQKDEETERWGDREMERWRENEKWKDRYLKREIQIDGCG